MRVFWAQCGGRLEPAAPSCGDCGAEVPAAAPAHAEPRPPPAALPSQAPAHTSTVDPGSRYGQLALERPRLTHEEGTAHRPTVSAYGTARILLVLLEIMAWVTVTIGVIAAAAAMVAPMRGSMLGDGATIAGRIAIFLPGLGVTLLGILGAAGGHVSRVVLDTADDVRLVQVAMQRGQSVDGRKPAADSSSK